MTSTSKKLARPTTRKPNEGPDPVGFAATFAKMLRSYRGLRCGAGCVPAPELHRQRTRAGSAPEHFCCSHGAGQPVSVDFRITFYPADAFGFFPADGELMTPVAEFATELQRDEQSDDPEYADVEGLFGNIVRRRRPKGGWRKFGRRR